MWLRGVKPDHPGRPPVPCQHLEALASPVADDLDGVVPTAQHSQDMSLLVVGSDRSVSQRVC